MEIPINDSTSSPVHAIVCNGQEQFARLISNLLCPPLTITLGIVVVVSSLHDSTAWIWALIAMILSIGIPVGYITWKVRSGKISDFHIPIRSQRLWPMMLMVCCALLSWGILWIGRAPRLLISITALGALHTLVMLLITLRWKISGHSAAIAGLAMVLVHFLGTAMTPAILLVPLVAWARIRIRRHTLAQTIAGAISGIVFISLLIWTQ